MSELQRRSPDDLVRIIDESGRVLPDATVPDLDDETLVAMYRDMRLMRAFDERAVSLQRQGRLGTYPPLAGQEAAQIGSGYATAPADWSFSSYRETGFNYVQGARLASILQYWGGDERGSEDMGTNVFPLAIPIATQIPHATGAAWAAKLQGDDVAVVCHFGDGATSEGDFHEGLNFAGVFDVPIVFLCHNNQWAISIHREQQTASKTLAQKATGYGFEGIRVDGMDPLAVYRATSHALERAKADEPAGPRPTMIEAIQYRYGPHTTADDPSTYRDEEAVERWHDRDPIERFESFLRHRELLSDGRVEELEEDIEAEIADAVETFESFDPPDPRAMFEHVYAEPTNQLREQREDLASFLEQAEEDR